MPSDHDLKITGATDYKHWELYLADQRYLGRCVAWIKRDTPMLDLNDLSKEEHTELFELIAAWKMAISNLWQPDLFNYAWLGNYIHEHGGHGHMHLIPRYESERYIQFDTVATFVDNQWGQNYAPYERRSLPDRYMQELKSKIASMLLYVSRN